jgi:hypothetical protein
MPASLGVQGPGEITMCVGLSDSISSMLVLSLRSTRIGRDGSSSPMRCTRL